MMRARCPNCSSEQFVTVAHVAQDWIVDPEGDFLELPGSNEEVTHKPNPDNIWTCAVCGVEAILEK